MLGLGDVTHFYKQKRVIGMREEGGVVLACVRDVWTRLVGMTAGAASSGEGCGGIGGGGVGGGARRRTPGMSMRDFRLLTPKEREFILCALLVRRVDDAAIVNVRATMLAGGGRRVDGWPPCRGMAERVHGGGLGRLLSPPLVNAFAVVGTPHPRSAADVVSLRWFASGWPWHGASAIWCASCGE